MQPGGVDHNPIAPSASTSSVVAALSVYDFARDTPRVAVPRPESCIVVRFGPSARRGLDIHALGPQQRAHRKLIRGGGRAAIARLQLGAQERVLGVPASAIAGRIVALEDLWGGAAARRLIDRLARSRDTAGAAAILESEIADRLAITGGNHARAELALAAADKLVSSSVRAVAVNLGVSERHLRRVFRETIGMSPKKFTQLMRFHRALRAAREDRRVSWASIAAAAGYYDQAHLIAEFRVIAGVTPQALLRELCASGSPASATA